MCYLLDTNIVIYYLRGNKEVVNFVDKILTQGLAVSTITLAELFHGANKSQNAKRNISLINQFIDTPQITVLQTDEIIAASYGKLMAKLEQKGTKLAGIDTLIAATAISNNLIILTADKKHFPRLSKFGLKIQLV